MSRSEKKVLKKFSKLKRAVPNFIPKVSAEVAEYLENTCEFTDMIDEMIESTILKKEESKIKENSRIGFSLRDCKLIAEKYKFKNAAKKASFNYEDALIGDKKGVMIFMDDSQNELRIFASYKSIDFPVKIIWWIGKSVHECYRDDRNIYTIRTDEYRIILDRNKDDILDMEEVEEF